MVGEATPVASPLSLHEVGDFLLFTPTCNIAGEFTNLSNDYSELIALTHPSSSYIR